TWERFGDRFVDRLLMEEERSLFAASKWPARFLAMRFAGKEATVKAMGTGFAHGMWLRDVGIVSNAWGRPLVLWSERGRAVCRDLGIGEGHVSLSDDGGLVLAFAVVTKAPPTGKRIGG
ncbi:MAG: holo-ACP synthase, partial [Woeseiaceae bacterium]